MFFKGFNDSLRRGGLKENGWRGGSMQRMLLSLKTKEKKVEQPKAAICIIGTEVLTGKIKDTNTNFLAKFLFKKGIKLIRTETIRDDMDDIVATVRKLSNMVGPNGYLFTSGGIGPTHDDITYGAIAKAFNKKLALHENTFQAMSEYLLKKNAEGGINEARRRMALLPEGCEVLTVPDLWVPLAVCENVYILPGIPKFLEQMVHSNEKRFVGHTAFSRAFVRTLKTEGSIASILSAAQAKHPEVEIGSYPRCHSKDTSYNVQVSIEGPHLELVMDVTHALQKAIDGYIVTADQAEAEQHE